jgi:type II secretory ATPase GspE/PulE/Tfp pilus assembly ATPase PilB-like protein
VWGNMTDKSNTTDDNKVVDKTSAPLSVEKTLEVSVTSFEDLEDVEDELAINDTTGTEVEFEEPMSLAEEELNALNPIEDDFELPDLDNSFAEDADKDEVPMEDPFALPEEYAEEPVSQMPAVEDVAIIMNPVFKEELQEAADPFPLPEELSVHATALDEPAMADLSLEKSELELDMDVAIEPADEVVLAEPLESPAELEILEEVNTSAFTGLELDMADDSDGDLDDLDDLDELPDLGVGGFGGGMTEGSLDEKFFKDTIRLSVDDLYSNVLKTLYECDDIGIDAAAKARVGQSLKLKKLPQMVCRDLVIQKIVSPVQLARAIARTQKRKEITSFLNIPHESMGLRQALDSRVCALLREARVIPLWHKIKTEEDDITGSSEMHLAHEAPTKNLVLEAAISELLPDHKFVWHFALRDVCGAYWLSGEDEDVDSNMEADALLDRIVGNAIDARSSDIHIDPSIKGDFKAMVRYRIDGFVQSKEVITLDQLQRLRIRIENIARMPKVDLHHPNKGAFTRSGYDWRIQIQPHSGRQGPLPRIVIRRLNPDVMTMEELGYPEYFTQFVRDASKSPNGVILWTGPTGSGKTESIHSAIVSANPMGRGLSVHTIEDPPEKRVAGYAVQMEIAERDPARSGMELLKSSLRADPDVVVFGEVRDAEMAGLVFEAANTGHLVFSTLHTNTSLDAIVRLDELGIYGFNISYVRGIAAQRLVRRLCTHCKQPVHEIDEYTKYVFDKFTVDPEGAKLFTHDPNGCPSCNYTGYHGRIAIAEWLSPNKEIVNLSVDRNYTKLEETAKRAGWKPMGYMGVLHLKNGITDVHELASKVQELAGDL